MEKQKTTSRTISAGAVIALKRYSTITVSGVQTIIEDTKTKRLFLLGSRKEAEDFIEKYYYPNRLVVIK